jgi:hypothetical protein
MNHNVREARAEGAVYTEWLNTYYNVCGRYSFEKSGAFKGQPFIYDFARREIWSTTLVQFFSIA